MVRAILVALAALSGGVAIGRKALDRLIEKRLPSEIDAAKAIAEAELDKRIGEYIQERLASFLFSIGIKTGLVGAFYLLFSEGELTSRGLKIVVTVLLGGFIIRDIVRTAPFLARAIRHIRRHDWNPSRALKELVAGVAFERAYASALTAAETGPHRFWLAFSRYSPHRISVEVAEAVAEVARSTSLRRARWRALTALTIALLTSAAYAGFLFVTIAAT